MENIPWVLYALLGALLATQVILLVMVTELASFLREIVDATNSQTRDLLAELQGIRYDGR